MSRSRMIRLVAGLLLVLGMANHTIIERQRVVDVGQPILLQLRPVDPRSLMQGDYMVLAYHTRVFPPEGARTDLPVRGAFVVKLDELGIADFARLDDGSQLAADEALLKYKLKSDYGDIRLGAESYFFQEGNADLFDDAEYGVLHVDDAGNSVLVGLAGEDGKVIRVNN